jgi:dihydroflavonol-4-reductase
VRIFLTGATGFIGQRLALALRQADHEVVALVRRPQAAQQLTDIGVQLAPGDLTDRDSIRAGMPGATAVIHTAAWYKVGVRDSSPAYPTNVEGTRFVLEAMRDLAIPRGLYPSTIGVNSDTHGVEVNESYRHNGPWLSHYERTKWQAHYEVALPMIEQGLPLSILMPSLVYGPGDQGPTHDFMVDFLRRRLPMAPQRTAFSWAHVDDIVQGHVQALEKARPGESYLLTGPSHTMQEAIELLTELTGIKGPAWKPRPATVRAMATLLQVVGKVVPLPPMMTAEVVRGIAGNTYIGTSTKAQQELGFAPRTLREGLRETVRWEMQRLGMPIPPSPQAGPEASG